MSDRIEDFESVVCAGRALGQLLMLKPQSISRLAKMDAMPKVRAGQYSVIECVNWYIERERERSGATPEDKKARIAVAKQQELRYKIENGEKLNQLLPADLVASGFAAMASQLASLLDALGPRMAAELSPIDDPAIIQKLLFDECRSIREAAAAAFAEIAGDISSKLGATK